MSPACSHPKNWIHNDGDYLTFQTPIAAAAKEVDKRVLKSILPQIP